MGGCPAVVAEHWWLKPEVSWGLTPGDSRPLHFSLYVHPINFFGFSKRQDALSNNKAPWTQGPFLP